MCTHICTHPARQQTGRQFSETQHGEKPINWSRVQMANNLRERKVKHWYPFGKCEVLSHNELIYFAEEPKQNEWMNIRCYWAYRVAGSLTLCWKEYKVKLEEEFGTLAGEANWRFSPTAPLFQTGPSHSEFCGPPAEGGLFPLQPCLLWLSHTSS